MEKKEFVNICKAVSAGQPRRVKHLDNSKEGRVIACGTEDDYVEVELDNGERASWAIDDISLLS